MENQSGKIFMSAEIITCTFGRRLLLLDRCVVPVSLYCGCKYLFTERPRETRILFWLPYETMEGVTLLNPADLSSTKFFIK